MEGEIKGRMEGEIKGKIEIAKKAIEMGMSIYDIISVCP